MSLVSSYDADVLFEGTSPCQCVVTELMQSVQSSASCQCLHATL